MVQVNTICALATPPGQSALCIVRISGPRALEIKESIFYPHQEPQKHFTATRGFVLDIDDAMCISYPDHKSFTGEPSFELFLHGSPVIATRVLETLQEQGARLARPGEFSLRAYQSGKIDLSQAEAIADLIHARSEEAAKAALRNLKGGLSNYLESTRIHLVDILCEIEARLDFPDEKLGTEKGFEFTERIKKSLEVLKKLLQGALLGKRLTEGARIVFLGLPNAGKSTLFNTLLGEDKALVHEAPGTTRDVIEASWVLEGIPLTLVDIAGFRDGVLDPVERLGIEKAKRELEKADLVLYLQDPHQEKIILPHSTTPVIEIESKSDLLFKPKQIERLYVSAKTGEGLEDLKKKIKNLLLGENYDFGEILLTRLRQKEEVMKAYECLLEVQEALDRKEADEIIAFELRSAGSALDRLLGKNLNEDVLDLIFSRFCIGK